MNITILIENLSEHFGVTVVGIKRANEEFEHATATTMIQPGDLLVVSGLTRKIERFAGSTDKG